MSFLTNLASAFKGGGGHSHVPLDRFGGRGFVSPWATAFDSAPQAYGRLPQFDYASAVSQGYLANPVAQRSVRIVAEGVGGAPLCAEDAALERLVTRSCGTTPLLEVISAQLLLHGNAYVQVIRDAAGAPIADAFARLLAETAPVTRQGLERWVTAGVITEWPSRPADRDELLAWVLERAAEPGESLGERELTERLAALGHDPVALRRALVDAQLVTRTVDGSTYRRS